MKKFLLLIFLFPSIVLGANFEYSPNRYFGYFQTITDSSSNNVMLSYYNNGWIDDDSYSSLQVLSGDNSDYFRFQISTYGICQSNSNNCLYSGINDSDLRFFEQDICVSSNKLKFHVWNSSVEDFASTNVSNALVTDQKCSLFDNDNIPSDLITPSYWEWLSHNDGYVVKLFMPIHTWHSYSDNNGQYYSIASRLYIDNLSDHDIYFRFLTSGGLFDHSRYFEIDNSFDLTTNNFDLTLDAIQDGVEVLDSISGLKYQISKNIFNPDIYKTNSNSSR